MDKFDLIKKAFVWAEWHDERSVKVEIDKAGTRIWVYDHSLHDGTFINSEADLENFKSKTIDDQICAAENELARLREMKVQHAN